MRVEFSGVQPADAGRRQEPAGVAPAEESRKRAVEAQPQREDGPRAEASARVNLSAEAKKKLAEEDSGARAEIRKAADEKGPVAKLLETQKERVSQAGRDDGVRPPPTRPSADDQASIRAAQQRLASAGLTA